MDELSDLAVKWVKQAVEAAAEVIATTYPFCQANLNAIPRRAGLGQNGGYCVNNPAGGLCEAWSRIKAQDLTAIEPG